MWPSSTDLWHTCLPSRVKRTLLSAKRKSILRDPRYPVLCVSLIGGHRQGLERSLFLRWLEVCSISGLRSAHEVNLSLLKGRPRFRRWLSKPNRKCISIIRLLHFEGTDLKIGFYFLLYSLWSISTMIYLCDFFLKIYFRWYGVGNLIWSGISEARGVKEINCFHVNTRVK